MSGESGKTRILCVDDHTVVYEGLKAGMRAEPDMECVGRLETAEGLVEKVDEVKAGVVLMDIDMPGPDSFGAMRQLLELRYGVRVLVLSGHVRDTYIDAAVAAGAAGYISKNSEFERIIDAIRRVARGEFVFAPEVLERCRMTKGRLELKEKPSRLSELSARDVQVVRMIAQGASTAEIAKAIHRSEKRVEAIRTEIMRKTGCSDRVELTRYAIREGLADA